MNWTCAYAFEIDFLRAVGQSQSADMVRGERKAGFDKNGVSQSSPRMSKFANAIMNANQVGKRSKKRKGKDKGENSQKEGLFLLCVPKNVPDMDDLNVNGCRETVVPIDDARSSAGSDGQAAAGEVKNKPDLSQCTRKS
eukprot:1834645-Rhodomonas_salina.1